MCIGYKWGVALVAGWMLTWMLTWGTFGGLIALIAAATLVWITQFAEHKPRSRWLLSGLSMLACSGMILYGGSLLGSLYIQMTRLVSTLGPP